MENRFVNDPNTKLLVALDGAKLDMGERVVRVIDGLLTLVDERLKEAFEAKGEVSPEVESRILVLTLSGLAKILELLATECDAVRKTQCERIEGELPELEPMNYNVCVEYVDGELVV